MTWLEGPQKAEEFGENDEFGESDKSDETISPSLLNRHELTKRCHKVNEYGEINENNGFGESGKIDKIWPSLQTKFYDWISIIGLEKVDECCKKYKCVESDKCDEISPRLLAKLYEWVDIFWLEGP